MAISAPGVVELLQSCPASPVKSRRCGWKAASTLAADGKRAAASPGRLGVSCLQVKAQPGGEGRSPGPVSGAVPGVSSRVKSRGSHQGQSQELPVLVFCLPGDREVQHPDPWGLLLHEKRGKAGAGRLTCCECHNL